MLSNSLVRFTIAFVSLLILAPLGCASQDPATVATVAKVYRIQSQGAVAVAKATTRGAVDMQLTKNKVAINQVNGEKAPATHPIAAANNTVRQLHGPLLLITILSCALWGVAFALSFTTYNFLNSFIPALRMLAILSIVSLFVLPFLPLGIFAVIGAAVAMLVYELIKDKGNVPEAITDTETTLGFRSYQASAGKTVVTEATKSTVTHTTAPTPAIPSPATPLT